MCLNWRCTATPEEQWVELVIEQADGSIARERHSETAGVLLVNVAGNATALEETGKRVWWADEYDAAHPVWTPVGQRGNRQRMRCSLHGEYAYQLGLTYYRPHEGGCGGCHAAGLRPTPLAVLEGAPF